MLPQRSLELGGEHAPLAVGRHDADAIGPEAEEPAGAGDRHVRVGAGKHP